MTVEQPPLAEPHKIIIPPLHIKLTLVKNLVKAMDKNEPAFKYLHEKFPRLNVAKIKEAVFVGLSLNSFSDTPSLRNFFEVKENRFGIKCQQTSQGMTRPKATRFWLRICWLHFRISAAICP
ncbi:hypothetical protein AVEN_183191-1 [Araneus ventricosus]|uniref:Uncharacterized protein n=1 Tax=Araneus ventricosus TaxID=182803 RepID=A0A4Y2J7C0_ARAVE|nr:hypothetical protein AVEN_183191-1 [Araneus ventricosus]